MIEVDVPDTIEKLKERTASFISFEMQQLKPNVREAPIHDVFRFNLAWALVEATIKELMNNGLDGIEKSLIESKLFDE